MTRPTDPKHEDPTEQGTPAGQVEDLIEEAEEQDASTNPAASDIGEEQLEKH
jgi:hypothetical protein